MEAGRATKNGHTPRTDTLAVELEWLLDDMAERRVRLSATGRELAAFQRRIISMYPAPFSSTVGVADFAPVIDAARAEGVYSDVIAQRLALRFAGALIDPVKP